MLDIAEIVLEFRGKFTCSSVSHHPLGQTSQPHCDSVISKNAGSVKDAAVSELQAAALHVAKAKQYRHNG